MRTARLSRPMGCVPTPSSVAEPTSSRNKILYDTYRKALPQPNALNPPRTEYIAYSHLIVERDLGCGRDGTCHVSYS